MAAVETQKQIGARAGEVRALERAQGAARHRPHPRPLGAGGAHDPRVLEARRREDVEKVLRSAVANAESRPDLHWNGDDLVVATAYVDEGPTLKRFRAARPRPRSADPQAHRATSRSSSRRTRARSCFDSRCSRGEDAAKRAPKRAGATPKRLWWRPPRPQPPRSRRPWLPRGEAQGCSPEEEDRGE